MAWKPRPDPEAEFARRLAGRRFEDAATADGWRSLAYQKKFRPYAGADGRRRHGWDAPEAA